ncbi:hypothetical protein GCM10011316_04760 [Roseibium aquae]|uniref:Cryptochrome/DNA photolyase FAD-binding domain-containing protein n=1 Tax=Roseibium aquae TaxID=1323746 RepID=A0A916WWN0_9HYPH|nr:FAD-binding domain-containing protein [Roseibium aquae]GGB35653.1 hypothetical protein GCM10011316_04760 [Roseibium aquae]
MTQLDLISDTADTIRSWDPAREAALERLRRFVPSSGRTYADTRNHDFGPDNRSNISALSPWIRHRVILEEEVLAATLNRFSASTAEKFIQEVFWRGYFKGWLEQRPDVWIRYRTALAHQIAALDANSGLRKAYCEAVEGRTGIACFDAWAKELTETGYLHNHARMWFASIWIFTLRLPWELGADFFYRHLLDGDPASNTLSWRWVGGLHTKGKTYLAIPDNIARYTGGRFRDTHGLARAAEPLDEPPLGGRVPIPAASAPPRSGRCVLLITEEDTHPESWETGGLTVVAAAGLSLAAHRSPLPVSPAVERFSSAVVNQGLARSARHFGLDPGIVLPAENWTGALAALAQAADANMIATAYAPAGPVGDALRAAAADLAAAGLMLIQFRRPYDDLVWPHATAGFFKVKAKIPQILERLGL